VVTPGDRGKCEIYFSVVQRKVVTPNDFYDLADVRARLVGTEDERSAPVLFADRVHQGGHDVTT
jgi:hypothetical protein